jgi:hypothetical protein
VRLLALGVLVVSLTAVGASSSAAPPPALSIRVVGNHFVNGSGKTIRLLGVNRSSFETACVKEGLIYDGPIDAKAIAAMTTWHINVVRIPLNEACWLGLPTVQPQAGGLVYRNTVVAYVKRLHRAGLYVILDLHWNVPGSGPANGQQFGPDLNYSPAFWRSVARTFKSDHAVLFDAYNEPRMGTWSCWRNGCTAPGGWQTAGMQMLVNAIRSTGATQPIMLGGLGGAIAIYGWLDARPRDPANQLVAANHSYNFAGCSTPTCWNASIAPIAKKVPVVTGEIDENDCAHGYVDAYMSFADAHGISYLGWTWNPWDCQDAHAMITDWNGTPNTFGVGIRDHFAQLARLVKPS